jgi:NAD(P)-dependent dehydrogenase (short-subunit alcohol dehydrogenase family)
MDLKIKGKVAIVTGGTKGIGRAIVEAFADEGANVAFCARNKDEVAETEKALVAKGVKAKGTVVDVGDAKALRAWVASTAKDFGGIDMAVAHVSALAIPDEDDNWDTSFKVDLMGTVNLCKAVIPHLDKSSVKSLVAISSVSGREADFAAGPYGTVKTAIIGYMAGLSLSLAEKGIRSNTVSPGNTYFPGGVWQSIEGGNPDLFSFAMGLNPTGRMGTAEEIASGVVFISSPVASRISGANLLIDGALTRGIQF